MTLVSGKNVFEVLGHEFTLLAFDAAPEDSQVFLDAAAKEGVRLSVVNEKSSAESTRYQAKWVLLRPDQFVAWASQDMAIDLERARHLLRLASGR